MGGKFKCPLCGKEIDHIDYMEEGTYTLYGDGVFDDCNGFANELRVSCPECHGRLEHGFSDGGMPAVRPLWEVDDDLLREKIAKVVLCQVPTPAAYERMVMAGAEYYVQCYGENAEQFVDVYDKNVLAYGGKRPWRLMTSDERHEALARIGVSHVTADLDDASDWWWEHLGFSMEESLWGISKSND